MTLVVYCFEVVQDLGFEETCLRQPHNVTSQNFFHDYGRMSGILYSLAPGILHAFSLISETARMKPRSSLGSIYQLLRMLVSLST